MKKMKCLSQLMLVFAFGIFNTNVSFATSGTPTEEKVSVINFYEAKENFKVVAIAKNEKIRSLFLVDLINQDTMSLGDCTDVRLENLRIYWSRKTNQLIYTIEENSLYQGINIIDLKAFRPYLVIKGKLLGIDEYNDQLYFYRPEQATKFMRYKLKKNIIEYVKGINDLIQV